MNSILYAKLNNLEHFITLIWFLFLIFHSFKLLTAHIKQKLKGPTRGYPNVDANLVLVCPHSIHEHVPHHSFIHFLRKIFVTFFLNKDILC